MSYDSLGLLDRWWRIGILSIQYCPSSRAWRISVICSCSYSDGSIGGAGLVRFGLFLLTFGLGVESLADSLDHLEEPIKVERVEGQIAADVDCGQPQRYCGRCGDELHAVGIPCWKVCGLGLADSKNVGALVNTGPEVAVDEKRLIGTPHQTTGEEGGDQHDAVVELGARTGHPKLVEEPVDVEEG